MPLNTLFGAIVEEVSLPHSNTVLLLTILSRFISLIKLTLLHPLRLYAQKMQVLLDTHVNSRSRWRFFRRGKTSKYVRYFVAIRLHYDAYYKKAGQVRTLIIQDFLKNASAMTDLGPTCSKCCL